MSAALPVVVVLVLAALATAFVESTLVAGIVALIAAVAMILVAIRMRPGEGGHLFTLIRPLAVLLAVPALWMVIQVIPLPVGAWAHPIWQSADAALATPVAGTISADPGLTLLALGRYLTAAAALFAATAVAIDRARASLLLSLLVAVGTVAAIALLLDTVGLPISDAGRAVTMPSLRIADTLGIIFAAAAFSRAGEHRLMRHSGSGDARRSFAIELALCGAALLLCIAALASQGFRQLGFAASCGLIVFAMTVGIRWIGLRGWEAAACWVVAVALIASLIVYGGSSVESDFALRYALDNAPSALALAQRMMADAPLLGTGAGTFAALAPIYRELGDPLRTAPPTAMAEIVIEMGWPILWIAAATLLGLAVAFVRGAMQRGRDSFYPAAGAGAVIVVLVEAACDTSVLTGTGALIVAVGFGVALAQSVSRTLQNALTTE